MHWCRGLKLHEGWHLAVLNSAHYHLVNVLVASVPESGNLLGKDRTMHFYMHMYLPLLFSACIVTAGYVLAWALGGDGIDPGPPNARL
jgi:hypothetical protein